ARCASGTQQRPFALTGRPILAGFPYIRPVGLVHLSAPGAGSKEIAMQLRDTSLFRQQAYIDGTWQDADSGQTIKVNNPASNEILGTVPKMGAAETRRAIDAAERALPAWRDLTAKERSQKLRR